MIQESCRSCGTRSSNDPAADGDTGTPTTSSMSAAAPVPAGSAGLSHRPWATATPAVVASVPFRREAYAGSGLVTSPAVARSKLSCRTADMIESPERGEVVGGAQWVVQRVSQWLAR